MPPEVLGMENKIDDHGRSSVAMRVLAVTETPDRPTIELFIGLKKNNLDISVICKSGWRYEKLLNENDIETFEIPFFYKFHYSSIKKLRSYLLEKEIDIVHVYTNNGLSNSIFSLYGLRKIKLVAYRGIVGNVSFIDPISWIRFLNPRIDKVICVCNAIRDYFLAMKPRFLVMPEDKPITIYKGHKIEWYQEVANLESLNVPKGSFVVGCIANSRPRKGIEYLIGALNYLSDDIPICLLLIGKMHGQRIEHALKDCKRSEDIIMPGFCDNAPAISAACDVVCLPSYKREGLPRSIIEAMAAGTPPIVTNSGGSPELVENNKSGIVVPIRDSKAISNAIEKLYFNKELRMTLGENAVDRIKKNFSTEETINKTLETYYQLVDG